MTVVRCAVPVRYVTPGVPLVWSVLSSGRWGRGLLGLRLVSLPVDTDRWLTEER